MAWRILRGGEEMEPGGSYSRQALGRYKDGQKPDQEQAREIAASDDDVKGVV